MKPRISEMPRIFPEKEVHNTDQIDHWKDVARNYEKLDRDGFLYPATRTESSEENDTTDSIVRLHGESFIKNIDRMLNRDSKITIKVLDLGGGANLYAEQIRKRFGDRVRVYTTGLTKESPRKMREAILADGVTSSNISGKNDFDISLENHKDDLKWRTVTELRNFPEFDLIIDTIGEYEYNANNLGKEYEERYFNAIVAKLLPGGKASVTYFHEDEKDYVEKTLSKHNDIIFNWVPLVGDLTGGFALKIEKKLKI